MRGSRILLFIISLLLWFVLSFSFTRISVVAGILASALVALIAGDLFTKNPHKLLDIKRYLWFFVYAGRLFWDMLVANIELLWLMTRPKMDLSPKIIEVHTSLKSGTGITALANTITLISGMATVDLNEDGSIFEVYFLKTTSEKEKLLAKIQTYEKYFMNIFEEK